MLKMSFIDQLTNVKNAIRHLVNSGWAGHSHSFIYNISLRRFFGIRASRNPNSSWIIFSMHRLDKYQIFSLKCVSTCSTILDHPMSLIPSESFLDNFISYEMSTHIVTVHIVDGKGFSTLYYHRPQENVVLLRFYEQQPYFYL